MSSRSKALWSAIPAHEKRMTLSTMVTIFRMLLTPVIVIARIQGAWALACGLFVVAAVSDFLDGWLARIRNEETILGACLDPVADKLLIVSCFAVFALQDSTTLAVPVWFVVTMLVKELILCIGALCVYIHTGHIEVKPTLLGKATTAIQLMVITWLFACHFFVWMPIRTYTFIIGLLFCLVGITLVQYGRIGLRLWKGQEYE
jgi:cardiolipin synthase (CMP-forming)